MSLEDIQKQVDVWAQQFTNPYWEPLAQMARLTEETGEVAREINNLYGPKKKKDSEKVGNLGQELADVLFTVCCIANNTEINLQNEWAKMMEQKHYGRDNQRFDRKS